ncbi:hypothetical protein R3P38DRAFT_1860131 [Favolaschia claudopus]|uniref:Secreted protein n=1 Tax=Favolaschia claudopus TaxID=2862362 RepID=A0AAW0D9U8_9AGAR
MSSSSLTLSTWRLIICSLFAGCAEGSSREHCVSNMYSSSGIEIRGHVPLCHLPSIKPELAGPAYLSQLWSVVGAHTSHSSTTISSLTPLLKPLDLNAAQQL